MPSLGRFGIPWFVECDERHTSEHVTVVQYLVSELCDTSLFPFPCPSRLVVDLVEAAQHLHGMGIVHRDIKPGNVLVFRSEELGLHGKLADFGFARGEYDPFAEFSHSDTKSRSSPCSVRRYF